jgi:hypothetical protein
MARILYLDGHPDGGELILPGRTGYDVELLVEYTQWFAHRYGEVCLVLENRVWLVNALSGRAATCIGCHQRRAELCFEGGAGEVWLCLHCAQDELLASRGGGEAEGSQT